VTYAGTRDGTGRYGSSLCRELRRHPDVELIEFRAPRIERIPRPLRLPFNGILHLIWIQFVAPLWAWRRRVDVLHMATTAPFIAPCPVVVTIHDGLDFYPELRPSRIWSSYVRWIGARAARRADGVITVSEASAAEISRLYHLPSEKIYVVMHGSQLPPPASASSANGRPYVLMVASATRRKNFETALAAVEIVRSTGRALDFVVVGAVSVDTDERDWLRIVTAVDDATLAALYQGAVAVVIPSRHEGFGLPAIEALALGTAVVASDLPALREVTRQSARYAPPERADRFADEIMHIIDDPARERERIRDAVSYANSLSWSRAADQTITVYHAVIASGNRERVWKSLSTVGSRLP
jgi:glycosyltransferase involved in cell wall biosynthesis